FQLDSVRGHTLWQEYTFRPRADECKAGSRAGLEAAQAGGEHHAARAEAGREHVDVADLEWFGRLNGHADDLAEAGGEHAQDGVPGQARDVAPDEHETGGSVDDAEDAGEDEPGRQRLQGDGREGRQISEFRRLKALDGAYGAIAGSSISTVLRILSNGLLSILSGI